MRTLVSLLVIAAAAGCGTDSTVSGVFPAEGLSGRTMRVEISGDATEWSGSPGVNFGPGVTVSNVTVASPTSLFADITIDGDATPGARDVTITNDGTFTLKSSFMVESPISLTFDGQVAQGGAPYFTVTNLDFEAPFDLTKDADGNYANLLITAPSGVVFQIASASPYQLKGFALIDGDATPGPFAIASGLMGKQVPFNLGADVDVEARAPMALSDGATGTLAAVGDSALYSIDISQVPALVREVVTTSETEATPTAYLLPDGKWSQAMAASLTIVQDAGTYNVVVFDNGTAAGYNFSLKSKAELLTSAPEASEASGGNGTTSGATVASMLPFTQTDGTISAAGDRDWIKVTLTAGAKLHVMAVGPNDFTDTKVDILNSAGAASVIGGAVDDATCGFFEPCGEDFVSPMLDAGTYFVDISQGSTPFDSSFNKYTAFVYVE